ncbi:MAG: lytic murein transglycosylase [Pseudomonadota bacterium]
MRRFTITSAAILALFSVGWASGPETSPRPVLRAASFAAASSDVSLAEWLSSFRERAIAQGIAPAVLDSALRGVAYDADIIRRDRNQAEFTKTVWEYLDTAVSDLRIANGRKAAKSWSESLAQIEARYGVEKEIVVAIWGLESAYGSFRGSIDTVSALVTLAYDGRRAAFFEKELIALLRILQSGDVGRAALRGSWAGAMGHTQFMPSSYQAHAVDFDQDGRRNIWGTDPRDALASTAAYLRHFGWQQGQPWGVEVRLPKGFDFTLADRAVTKLATDWQALGVAPVGAISDSFGPASLLLPGGAQGAAFMIFANFEVLEAYNTADAYVIGVGHLADRIAGGPQIRQAWPRQLRALTKAERIELQERLTAAGFDTVKIDAKMGPLTINAVRAFQLSRGILPDGYPSLPLLERLRGL